MCAHLCMWVCISLHLKLHHFFYIYLLRHNLSVPCLNIICYDWFNIQADWPIDEQVKGRQGNQTENVGMRKGSVRESPASHPASRMYEK